MSHTQNHTSHMAGFEMKSLNTAGRFAGYASVFGVVDSQRDVVERGAFAEAVHTNGHDVKLLWQHDPKQPIGYIRVLKEDALGLYIEAQLLLNTTAGREAYELLKAGAVKGLSIGFTPIKHRMHPAKAVRHLEAVRLWEISLVTFPANAAANVTVVKTAPMPERMTGEQAIRLQAAIEQATTVLMNQ
jgi:HK97 family phage prohead protease